MVKMLQSIKKIFSGQKKFEGICVLSFHGVVKEKKDPRLERNFLSVKDFTEQAGFLKKQTVIGLNDLTEQIGAANKNTVIITFDDGFENNLLAGEILKKHKLPWSIFVSAGALKPGHTIWTSELSLLILHGNAKVVDFNGKKFSLVSKAEREHSFQNIRNPLKEMTAGQKNAAMELIRAQFPKGETERLLEEFPSFKMLSWNDVRRLSSEGVEIGSHGVDHEIHHKNQPVEIRNKELLESKAKIENEIMKPCRFFAYPNGNFTSASSAEVKTAGYELAFTTRAGRITAGSERFLLPRVEPSEFFKNPGSFH